MVWKYYAVRKGKQPGIYGTWSEAEPQIRGFPHAAYKGFNSREEAVAFLAGTPPSPSKSGSSSKSSKSTNDNGKRGRAASPDVEDETGWDVVYSDGACKGNGQAGSIAGVGVWWAEGDPRNIAERCPGDQTNNRAELIAILRVLETVPETKKPLLIKSDSSYSLKCFKEWLPKWISNGFVTANKEPVKNAPLIRYISAHLDARARRGQRVKLQWVKGHAGIDGNEGADAQANIGARQPLLKEQDWAKLEAKLKERLEIEFQGVDKPGFVPPEISDPPEDIGSGDTGENPAKIRKTTREPLAKTVAGPSSSRSALQVPVVASSSAFTNEDLAEYANGLLDDDDLFAELSD